MRTRYFDRIPFDDHDTSVLIREAGVRLLREHGRATFDDQGSMLVANVDGYTFRYYTLAPAIDTPPVLPELTADGGFDWPTTPYCLDVEASELLFGLAFDVGGISQRRLVRGPWEYEIARAAGLDGRFHDGRPLPPCFPESRCRRRWPPAALPPMRKRRLRMPIRFSVAGYAHCIHRLLPSGSDFDLIVAAIDRSYRQSRSRDGACGAYEMGDATSFGIWGWAGERPVRLGRRMKRPDIAYWVSPVGGFEAAAALLLKLDEGWPPVGSSPDLATTHRS